MTSPYNSVQQLCLALPQTEEVVSHSFPTFKVAGKAFACYSLNHHGDEKVALTLNIGLETQRQLVLSAPTLFFIPPYSGSKGWVGIELNRGLQWDRVAELVCEAYTHVAPLNLSKNLSVPSFTAPDESLTAQQINPLKTIENRKFLERLRALCSTYPEVEELHQFGHPAFKAGKKTFAVVYLIEGSLALQLWIGLAAQQPLVKSDSRFRVPAYAGHNGWIDMIPGTNPNWDEIMVLLETSYRNFALKRMLSALNQRLR